MIEEPRQDWEGTPLRMLYAHYLSTEQAGESAEGARGAIREDWEGTPLRTLYSHYLRAERIKEQTGEQHDQRGDDYGRGRG